MDLDILKERHINKYVGSIPPRASRLLKQSLKSMQYDFGNLSMVEVIANLTKADRTALTKQVKNEDLVICRADKGDVTVIMTTSQYLDLVYKHLKDKGTYQPLKTDPTREIV